MASVALQSACGYYGHPSSVACRIIAAAQADGGRAEAHPNTAPAGSYAEDDQLEK